MLAGFVPPKAVAPQWGVIVLVDLPQRPRHPIVEGTVTRGLVTGNVENEGPFTLLDSPSWLAVGSAFLENEPEASAWTQRLLDQGIRFVPSVAGARVHDTLVCARGPNRLMRGRSSGGFRARIGSGSPLATEAVACRWGRRPAG